MAQANRSRNACCRRWWDLGNAMSSPTSATSSRRWVDQVPHPIELSKLGSRWAFFAAAVLVGFVGLAVVAHRAQHGTALDHFVLGWMIDHRRDWLTTVAIIITNAGSPVAVGLLAALVAALLWWH